MTKLQEIRSLQKQLPCRDDIIEEYKHNTVWEDWDAHHCNHIVLSDTIGDWQVMRKYDIEIQPNMDWESDLLDTLPKKVAKQYIDEYGDLKDCFYEDYEPNEHFYEFEYGEYYQTWINVKDHSVYQFGRIYKKDPEYCNLKGKWTCLNTSRSAAAQTFKAKFDGNSNSGFYMDVTIHEDIQKLGYTGLDALNWYCGCGDYWDEASNEAKFIKERNLIDFFTDMLTNQSNTTTLIRLYGLDKFLYVTSIEDVDYQREVVAALRICRKNHYEIKDFEIWKDYIKMLYDMEKDLHNAYYVCPARLIDAHDKLVVKYNLKKNEILRKTQMMQANKKLDQFLLHMQAFLDLHFENENVVIRPLHSPAEYVEEGAAMHNCVASYQERYDSLILSVRDHEDNRLATAEVNLKSYRIIQIRAVCNKPSEHEEEIAVLLTQNMQKIRRANRKQHKLLTAAALKAA